MDIQFRGGPLDGQRHRAEREPATDQVLYWVADDARLLDSPDVPGVEGLVEYIYRGLTPPSTSEALLAGSGEHVARGRTRRPASYVDLESPGSAGVVAALGLRMYRGRWIGGILRPALFPIRIHSTAAVGSALIDHLVTLERVPRPVPTSCLVLVDRISHIRRHLDERRIPVAALTP